MIPRSPVTGGSLDVNEFLTPRARESTLEAGLTTKPGVNGRAATDLVETARAGGTSYASWRTPAPPTRTEAINSRNRCSDSSPAISFLSAPIRRPPIAMLGVPFDHVSIPDCLGWIENAIASGRPHYVVTANVDFLVQARADVELRRILLDAHLVICDGTPLVWASNWLGNPLPERVAGADVVPQMIELASRKGYRIFFLGAGPEICSRAVERLTSTHPNLIIAGHYSPPFNRLLEMDHEEIARRIRDARPDLLFVCFGCPKQEKWMCMHYRSLGVPVSIGLGATIDFLAGEMKRAPLWMRRTGLEWTFRLAQEPRRLFRRYMKDLAVFGWAMASQWWRLQLRCRKTSGSNQICCLRSNTQYQRYKLPARLDVDTVAENASRLDVILADPRHCLLDASHVKAIDSTGLACLARLQQKLAATGRHLILLAPSTSILRSLRLARLREFFTCACDVPTAQQIVETREREHQAAVTRRTAASLDPLTWQGEITAANAETVWKTTRQHIHLLCAGWKTPPDRNHATNGHAAANGKPAANGNGDGNGNGHSSDADTSFLARPGAEPHPVLDALKFRILHPPTLPPKRLTIDLSNVRFIDSTGLGVMIRAKKLAGGHGAQLSFSGLRPTVRNVVRIARLEEFLL